MQHQIVFYFAPNISAEPSRAHTHTHRHPHTAHTCPNYKIINRICCASLSENVKSKVLFHPENEDKHCYHLRNRDGARGSSRRGHGRGPGSKGVYVQISWATEQGKIFIQIGYANKLRQSHTGTAGRSRARCRARKKTEYKSGWEAGKAGKWGNGAGWMGKQHAHDMRLRPGARTAAGHNEVWARLNEMSTAAWR